MERKTWREFKDSKLLWWVNRSLHLFGWAIVLVQEEDGTISDCYPARVSFRGFSEESEQRGFEGLTRYLVEEIQMGHLALSRKHSSDESDQSGDHDI